MVNARTIANTFLYNAFKENVAVSHTKLQMLVYLLYETYARVTKTPLFNETFEARKTGPVIKSLYDEFKSFGKNRIAKFSRNSDGEVMILDLNASGEVLQDCFNAVWDACKDQSADVLQAAACKIGDAWYKAYTQNVPILSFQDISSK